jgi:hypothetical protein
MRIPCYAPAGVSGNILRERLVGFAETSTGRFTPHTGTPQYKRSRIARSTSAPAIPTTPPRQSPPVTQQRPPARPTPAYAFACYDAPDTLAEVVALQRQRAGQAPAPATPARLTTSASGAECREWGKRDCNCPPPGPDTLRLAVERQKHMGML